MAAMAASQNSAPVAEFRCLFTHDIRRKQKRWQDGYLKFHAFNSRVMVYDQARNFLGDAYYKDSNELQEGDELHLNNGALVEVSEAMGITHTDLTPILDKKAKEQPPRPSAPSRPKPFQRPSSVVPASPQRTASQLRHKSLNTLLGTPKGPIGKAQPIKSPYEARTETENELAEERAPKRLKTAQAHAVWRASSPAQDESPIANKDPPPMPKTVHTRNAPKPAKFIPPSATVITIESESDLHPAYLSDVTLPSTPPNVVQKRIERTAKTPAPQPVVPRQAPAKTPKIPKGKVPVPSVRALETPKRPAPPSSPPVSASNRLSNIESALQPGSVPPKELSPRPPPPPEPSPPPARKAKSLRLSAGVKRGKLLCQSLSQQGARTGTEPKTTDTKVRARAISLAAGKAPLPAVSQDNNVTAAKATSKGKRRGAAPDGIAPKRARASKSPSLPSPSLLEGSDVMYGLMGQQLLIPSSSKRPQSAAKVSPPPPAKSRPISVSTDASPALYNESVPLPPHPLRANKKGPLVSTTELAALLQKPKNLAKALADPIEDEGNANASGKPPIRGFRRVGSESDAPIPSTAETWEKRNLAKASNKVTDVSEEPKRKKDSGLGALIKRTDPRRKFKRTQSLQVDTNPPLAVTEEVEVPSPIVDEDIGPWSTEAGDLFDWRPPGRGSDDERRREVSHVLTLD